MRLSMISSNIFYIYEYLSKKKRISISQDIIKYVEKANELYNDCYQILYSKKIQNLEKINRERETLIKKNTIEFLENNKGENSVIAHYLGEIIRIITAMGGYILSYTIDTN